MLKCFSRYCTTVSSHLDTVYKLIAHCLKLFYPNAAVKSEFQVSRKFGHLADVARVTERDVNMQS